MADALKRSESSLYERDFYAWTQDQAEKLRARAHNSIDWDNAAEEIESVGRSDKRQIRSRMRVILTHLLKWEFQPERRGESWRSTLSTQRTMLQGVLDDSPSLRTFPGEILGEAYLAAVREAAEETGLAAKAFPVQCPYEIADILRHGFYPETAV